MLKHRSRDLLNTD